jgi:carboxymethylenebutenolidase
LVVHSWWGFTASFARFADQLAASGFVAGCVDLFDGETATTDEEARRLRAAKRSAPAYRILQHCLDELADQPKANGADPAVIGFSMGGHWAIWLAQHPPPPISAVVLYYAARGGDFTNASAPILAHFAAQDPYVSASSRRTMERALGRHDVAYSAYDYPASGHWFAESEHPAFDPDAAAHAYQRSIAFLTAAAGPTPDNATQSLPGR